MRPALAASTSKDVFQVTSILPWNAGLFGSRSMPARGTVRKKSRSSAARGQARSLQRLHDKCLPHAMAMGTSPRGYDAAADAAQFLSKAPDRNTAAPDSARAALSAEAEWRALDPVPFPPGVAGGAF